MKRILIAILLATVLGSLPVFASARQTIREAGKATQMTGENVAVPLFMQLRTRRERRRRYRRAYVIRRRYYRRAYVMRHRRRYLRRRR